MWPMVVETSAENEPFCDVAKLGVVLLAHANEHLEGLLGGDAVAFHEDPFRAPDELSCFY